MELDEHNWQDNYSFPDWAGFRIIPLHGDFYDKIDTYLGILSWIEINVERPRSNMQWTRIANTMHLRFRKEKDLIMFLLRWGS